MKRYLGIVIMQVESDSPEAAQGVLERFGQQARYRVDRVAKTRVEGVSVQALEGVTASELAAAIRWAIAQRQAEPPDSPRDPT